MSEMNFFSNLKSEKIHTPADNILPTMHRPIWSELPRDEQSEKNLHTSTPATTSAGDRRNL
jgi:hypothetical protein